MSLAEILAGASPTDDADTLADIAQRALEEGEEEHDFLAGLHEGPDGRDLHVIDDAIHRRADFRTVLLSTGAAQRLLIHCDLRVDLAALVKRLLAEFEVRLARLRKGLANRRAGTALLLTCGGDPALQVDHFAPLVHGRSFSRSCVGSVSTTTARPV